MKLPIALRAILVLAVVTGAAAGEKPPVPSLSKPNIIVFLADDLGYGDVGVYGCKDIATPHLDSIAKNGVRFTDGYANHPICSPSRAGFLSGMYQQRFGFEHNSGPEEYAAANFGIPREVPILAERLKAGGYATCMTGKWHVGFKEGLRPHERGFDTSYGFLSGARSFYPKSVRQNHPLLRNGEEYKDETEYLTDAFARDSVQFIDRVREDDATKQPFFLFLSFNAVHAPLEATKEYEDRFPKITRPKRKTYAGMLAALDDAVGRVMAKVREHGEEEITLVFFYSDNGGPTAQTTSRNDPLRGVKGQMFEGGIRVPFMMQWPGTVPAGSVYREPVMGFDVHATALAAAGFELPVGERIDGKDLLPYLHGKVSGIPHEGLFWRAGAQHAARVGDWKLVKTRGTPAMLFNLAADLGEKSDLAGSEPGKLQELQAAFAAWSETMEAPRWIRQDRTNAEPGGKRKAEPAPQKGQVLQNAFKEADQDGDGKLSAKEFWNPDIFKALDTDGDGLATITEARTYYRSRRPKGGQQNK